MSYARWSDSDVYVAGMGDRIACMGGVEWHCGMFLGSHEETIEHLREHERRGDSTGDAIELLTAELAAAPKVKLIGGAT